MTDHPILFVSYSHKDEKHKDYVVGHLKVAEKLGHIKTWDDRRVKGGGDWRSEIESALAEAKVAILLVSHHSLVSDFFLDEEVSAMLRRRDQEGLMICPIIIRACDWQSVGWLKAMNIRPIDGKPLARFSLAKRDMVMAEISREIVASLDNHAGHDEVLEQLSASPIDDEIDRLSGQTEKLSTELGTTKTALNGMFEILAEQDVPAEQLEPKLREFAERHVELTRRLNVLASEGPEVTQLRDQLTEALEASEYEKAGNILLKIARIDGQAARELEPELNRLRSLAILQRPAVWLLPLQENDPLIAVIDNENFPDHIDWRSRTTSFSRIEQDDPVIFLSNEVDSPRIIGTGRFFGESPRTELEAEPSSLDGQPTDLHNIHVVQNFDDNFPSSTLIKVTGLEAHKDIQQLARLPREVADRIDSILKRFGGRSLFSKPEPIADASTLTFHNDAPKTENDFLNRSSLAFVLAARLNRIWNDMNVGVRETNRETSSVLKDVVDSRNWTGLSSSNRLASFDSGFVVHVDAAWGGGKTTFANFLTHILNPYRHKAKPPEWLVKLPINDTRFWPEEFRRPWCIVNFNAWEHEHVDPPWWCFYATIQRQTFRAVRDESFSQRPREGASSSRASDENLARDFLLPPSTKFELGNLFVRTSNWLGLSLKEFCWRISSPKVRRLAVTFLLTWLAAIILGWLGLFKTSSLKATLSGDMSNLSASVATAIIILFGGATAVWSVFATITETLLPGTPSAAKNYALGAGDPFERFRSHFNDLMKAIKRPVMVVVDDLDRCKPEFVVELVRGMQTIFKSQRVVFLLLGDRDWIEQAFAETHKSMKGIDVGPEHTFGSRFVEKAIQLSMVLPEVAEPEDRVAYVEELLGVKDDKAIIDSHLAEPFANSVAQQLDNILSDDDSIKRDAEVVMLRDSVQSQTSISEERRQDIVKDIDRKMSLRAAADETVRQAIRHRLVPLAPLLPHNPRQIKRILNGISLFQEIARLEREIQPGTRDWRKLTQWVVIMVEWPKTWTTLSRFPGLVDLLEDQNANWRGPSTPDGAVDVWVKAIKRNQRVLAILGISTAQQDWEAEKITTDDILRMQSFMPATSSRVMPLELPESERNVEESVLQVDEQQSPQVSEESSVSHSH